MRGRGPRTGAGVIGLARYVGSGLRGCTAGLGRVLGLVTPLLAGEDEDLLDCCKVSFYLLVLAALSCSCADPWSSSLIISSSLFMPGSRSSLASSPAERS